MPALRPEADELVGSQVRLALLREDDLPALFAAIAKPDVFASGFGGGPAGLPADFAQFRSFAASQFVAGPKALPWVVRLTGGPDAGAIVGTSTLGDLDLPNEGAHIGWTAYDPRVWATSVNPETKLLLLDLAFRSGFSRVKLQADSQNARSRGAIVKLGATFEGVLRHHRRRADGSWRNTAVYSILVEEWPAVRAGLEQRLAEWGDREVVLGEASGAPDRV